MTKRPTRLIIQDLLLKTYRNRFWITIFTLGTFLLALVGIILAIKAQATIDAAWKEILLVMLGAFIGSYQRVIDFWFNNQERDNEILKRADEEDDDLKAGTDLESLKVGEVSSRQQLNG